MRLSPRVKVALPVSFESTNFCCETLITDLGMSGAFINSKTAGQMELNAPVVVRYDLAGAKIITRGKILRRHSGGYAVSFSEIGREERKKLWEFISRRLLNAAKCPYCNEKFVAGTRTCQACGWDLGFDARDYFDYYEKTSTIRKISRMMSALKLDELYRLEEMLEPSPQKSAETTKQEGEDGEEFVGTCGAMLDVFTRIRKVADTDISVLITGESGTGKEMTAQTIHERSARKDKPFVAINCGAIPDNLLESELFGHEKGAFTGAYAAKKGKFECADGGTLFLDEIGEMPMALQVKLLRFLQDRIVERVGAVSMKKVDVRVIAATNCDLKAAIAEGRFRSDLFYRLNEFSIDLPPIRERENDKIILAKYYLNRFCKEKGVSTTFSSEAADAIMSYDWPGNVREIINKVRRAIVMGAGGTISPRDLDLEPQGAAKAGENVRLSHALAQVEKERIREALHSCNNNISMTAVMLGITRQTLHRRIKLLGLKRGAELLQ